MDIPISHADKFVSSLAFVGAAEMTIDRDTVTLTGKQQKGVLSLVAMLLTILLLAGSPSAVQLIDRLLPPFDLPANILAVITVILMIGIIIGVWVVATHPYPGRRILLRERLVEIKQLGRAVSMKLMNAGTTSWQSFIVFTPDNETADRLLATLVSPPENTQVFPVTFQPVVRDERYICLGGTGLVRIDGIAVTIYGNKVYHPCASAPCQPNTATLSEITSILVVNCIN